MEITSGEGPSLGNTHDMDGVDKIPQLTSYDTGVRGFSIIVE